MGAAAFIITGIVAFVALNIWHRSNCRKWEEIESREDNSLAGAMKRSMNR
jgi:hypothetical protein